MSSQDKLERVLRDIHVLISKSEAYDNDRIIIRKNDIFDLIDRLNESVYEIMDEYELTQQSREKALRENKKEGDKIIWDASRQAEDIYAASVMYTDEALNHLNDIVEQTNSSITVLYKDLAANMKKQQETIKENQLELKSQLQLLVDTEKYLKLIEERNKEIAKAKAAAEGEAHKKPVEEEEQVFASIKPEIKINEEYFRKAGIPIEKQSEEEQKEEELQEGVVEASHKIEPDKKEPKTKGPETKGPETKGPETKGPETKGPETKEPDKKIHEETGEALAVTEGQVREEELKEPEKAEGEQESKVDKEREAALRADLDAEYFQWKDDINTKPEPTKLKEVEPEPREKLTLLDKLIGKKK